MEHFQVVTKKEEKHQSIYARMPSETISELTKMNRP